MVNLVLHRTGTFEKDIVLFENVHVYMSQKKKIFFLSMQS